MFDSIGSKVDVNGNVTIQVLEQGKPEEIVKLVPSAASKFVAYLLAECAKRSPSGKPTKPIDRTIPIVRPTGFGLIDSTQKTPVCLTFYFGALTVGIAIQDARSLGEALIASGEEKTQAN